MGKKLRGAVPATDSTAFEAPCTHSYFRFTGCMFILAAHADVAFTMLVRCKIRLRWPMNFSCSSALHVGFLIVTWFKKNQKLPLFLLADTRPEYVVPKLLLIYVGKFSTIWCLFKLLLPTPTGSHSYSKIFYLSTKKIQASKLWKLIQ